MVFYFFVVARGRARAGLEVAQSSNWCTCVVRRISDACSMHGILLPRYPKFYDSPPMSVVGTGALVQRRSSSPQNTLPIALASRSAQLGTIAVQTRQGVGQGFSLLLCPTYPVPRPTFRLALINIFFKPSP